MEQVQITLTKEALHLIIDGLYTKSAIYKALAVNLSNIYDGIGKEQPTDAEETES